MSKILIVDDEKNICELVGIYLEKEGFDVTVFEPKIVTEGAQASVEEMKEKSSLEIQ